MAMKFADENSCDIIIANDPDADRLGAAENSESGWKIFTGNEIGVMLGHFQIMKYKAQLANVANADSLRQPAVLASVVSSRMLQSIARAEGVLYVDTLTGYDNLSDLNIVFIILNCEQDLNGWEMRRCDCREKPMP